MSSDIIQFPKNREQIQGFTTHQFRQLDALYLIAVSHKVLIERSVGCDFEEGVARFGYHKGEHLPPYLEFVIRRVGPRTLMFELFMEGKGRVMKSGLFDRTYERLKEEVEKLLEDS